MDLPVGVSVLAMLVAAFAVWLAYELLCQSGRILVRLEAVERMLDDREERLAAGPSPERGVAGIPATGARGNLPLARSRIARNGLPAGTPAPLFVLPLVEGGELSLQELRGHRILLVFSDPDCGPCDVLAPQLEQLCRRTQDVTVVMVSRGSLEANRTKARKHRLTFPVALQRQWEISRLYGMFATPIAYLIDEHGLISANVAVGPDAILDLVTRAATSVPRNTTIGRVQATVGSH